MFIQAKYYLLPKLDMTSLVYWCLIKHTCFWWTPNEIGVTSGNLFYIFTNSDTSWLSSPVSSYQWPYPIYPYPANPKTNLKQSFLQLKKNPGSEDNSLASSAGTNADAYIASGMDIVTKTDEVLNRKRMKRLKGMCRNPRSCGGGGDTGNSERQKWCSGKRSHSTHHQNH